MFTMPGIGVQDGMESVFTMGRNTHVTMGIRPFMTASYHDPRLEVLCGGGPTPSQSRDGMNSQATPPEGSTFRI